MGDDAGGDKGGAAAGGGKPLMEKFPEIKLNALLLTGDYEDQSEEAKGLEAMLVKPALFERLALIVPRYPLMDVEDPYDPAAQTATHRVMNDYTRLCYLFFNWLTLTCYPFAVILKELIRYIGFLIYYFWAVPCRYLTIYVIQPFLDGLYRLLRPCFVFMVVCTRPVTAILADISGAIGQGFTEQK